MEDFDGTEIEYLAEAIGALAQNIKVLGLNNAGTQMGAIEVLSMEIKEGSERIAQSISDLASAMHEIADKMP